MAADPAAMETTAASAEEHPMFFVDTTPAPVDTSSTPSNEAPAHTAEGHEVTADVPAPTEEQASFFIDTTPSMIDAPTTVPSRIAQLTRELQAEDEVIVYVAPHPRSTRATPAPAPPHHALPMGRSLLSFSCMFESVYRSIFMIAA